jgi:hypothetical protein
LRRRRTALAVEWRAATTSGEVLQSRYTYGGFTATAPRRGARRSLVPHKHHIANQAFFAGACRRICVIASSQSGIDSYRRRITQTFAEKSSMIYVMGVGDQAGEVHLSQVV